MNRRISICLISIFLSIVSCGDSLEDTYKKYAGDGENTYIGKCADLVLRPGWNRIIVSWTNSIDPRIDKIRLTWSGGNEKNEQLLEKGTTEFNITGLIDLNYEISVSGIDKEGKESLKITAYGRPYSETHESVLAFTRIISHHILIKDRLVLFFLGWEDSVEKAYLTFTKKGGTPGRFDLTPEIVNQLHFLVPDAIDASKPVTLYRTGYLGESTDRIVFAPIELDNVRLFNSDFIREMKLQFGFDRNIPDSWADNVEEIYLDRNITSLIDLLRLPNVKKLILGKHRYIIDEMIDDEEKGQSKIFDAGASNFVINALRQINGLTIERYNKHYNGLNSGYMVEKGQTAVPDYQFLDLKNLTFTSEPADEKGYDSHLEYLTDGNVNSVWEPYTMSKSTTFTLELDLKEVKMLKGMKLVQSYYDRFNIAKRVKSPNLIKIRVSENLQSWKNPIYLEDMEIGNSTGETNIIPFIEGGVQGRYVQIEFTTPFYIRAYEVSLAEIGLY